MKKLLMSAAVAVAVLSYAEDYSTWVYLTESDGNTSSQYSFSTAGKWSDPNPPDPAKRYYVPAGLTMKSSGGDATFGGGVIAVAGTVQVGNTGLKTVTWPELRLLPGGVYKHNSNNYVGGKVVIEGTEENPACFNSFRYVNKSFNYACSITGDCSSVVRFGHASLSGLTHDQVLETTVNLTGDISAFRGKLIVGGETLVHLQSKADLPCAVHVEPTGILHSGRTRGTVTMGDLSLADGAEITMYFDNCASMCWVVTNALALAGSPKVWLDNFDVNAGNSNGVTVVRLTGPAAANAPSAEAVAAIEAHAQVVGALPLPRNVRMALVDNGDGTKDVRVVYDAIVTMRTHNGAIDVSKSAFTAGNESYWSTGEIPGEDFEGAVYCAWFNLMALDWNTPLNFPRMELYTKGTFYAHVPRLTLGHLHMQGSAGETNALSTYTGPYTTTVDTPITFYPGNIAISGRSGRGFVFKKEIDGHADVVLMSNMFDGSNAFHVEFQTANTNFTGSFTLTDFTGRYNPGGGVDTALRVTLNDARNLGGAYAGDASRQWRALTFMNYVYVTAREDLDFAEPTRGLFVSGGVRLDVPAGRSVRTGAPLTFSGELVKLGGGELVLGGPARFTDGDAATAPAADANALTVSAGTLGAAATNALDGVAVTFAAGTVLKVDPNVADADMLRYGAVNVKWSAPFAVAGGGAVPVVFAPVANPDCHPPSFDVAICTVTSSAASGLSFALQGRCPNYSVEIVTRQNGDGTVTYLGRFARKGFMLTVY